MSDEPCHPDLEAALEAFLRSCEATPPRRGGGRAAGHSVRVAAGQASPPSEALAAFEGVIQRAPGGRLPEPLLARLLALLARPGGADARAHAFRTLGVLADLLETNTAAAQLGTPATAAAVWAAALRAGPAWDPDYVTRLCGVLGRLLAQPGSAAHLQALRRDLADWLQQAALTARLSFLVAHGAGMSAAATALHVLARLLRATGDDALVLRCARCEPLLMVAAKLAAVTRQYFEMYGMSQAAYVHNGLLPGVAFFVRALATSSPAAADALSAPLAMSAAATALLPLAAASGDHDGLAVEPAYHCLSAALRSPNMNATAARTLTQTVLSALRSDSEVERACVCRALVKADLSEHQHLPAPFGKLLAERGLAAGLAGALRRPEQSDGAALAAAAAIGMFAEASCKHAAVRAVAEQATSLVSADTAALGALARVAKHCAVWAPPPSEGVTEAELHSVHSAQAASALACILAADPSAGADGLLAAAARWLAAAAAQALAPAAHPSAGVTVSSLVRCLEACLLPPPPEGQPGRRDGAAACAAVARAAPELLPALAQLARPPPQLQADAAVLSVGERAGVLLGLLERNTATTSAAGSTTASVSEVVQPRCAHCGGGEDAAGGVTLKRCGGCRARRYCDAACAKAAWAAGHKAECKQLAVERAAAKAAAAPGAR